MGHKFAHWETRQQLIPRTFEELRQIVIENRAFQPVRQLEYGDYGLADTIAVVSNAIKQGKRIALYADYDVDGTMSAVSWIWFLNGIGYDNYLHYIPCRFREGYGVNLDAIKHLIDQEGAELIITMDTGITANVEAAYCRDRGVGFICTDHHKIQPEKMPDCVILNPKMHPDELYQELCGCGITFVLLRKLAQEFPLPAEIWQDILALAGMATICDVVPLNGVNHQLAKLGVKALMSSRREVLVKLRRAAAMLEGADEKDIGFRVGPRINAVGRLEHADKVVEAFVKEDPDELIRYMGECNEKRKVIQQTIIKEAYRQAERFPDDPVLFLGGDWHPGVVGIAASKITETFWKPTWLFQRGEDLCKGSARSVPGFDVTEAMAQCSGLFLKFGGHSAAGGFTFKPENEEALREHLVAWADDRRRQDPSIWRSYIAVDCTLPLNLADLSLAECLDELKPFGHKFEEPRFRIEATVLERRFLADRKTGVPKHTVLQVDDGEGGCRKVMFFNEVMKDVEPGSLGQFVVTAARNTFRGVTSLELYGVDWDIIERPF